MLQAEILRPRDLAPADRDAWKAFQGATPAFRSPLLGPAFAEAVADLREDAAVAVYRRDGRTVGFLAHHRRPAGLARPIGAPWSDYHALVCAPDAPIDGREALSAAGLQNFRFAGLVDPFGAFTAANDEDGVDCYLIAIEPGDESGDAHWERLRAASPKRFKNMRRLEHKLAREEGEVVLIAPDPSQDAFDRLLGWKRDQFRRTGLHDVLGPSWSRRLMQTLFDRRDGELQGLMLTLSVDGQPIAAHFGVRSGTAYHPWIAAYDPAFAAYSPGQTLISEAIRAMPRLGLERYDLSEGSEHYKKPFASEIFTVAHGETRVGPPTAFAASMERVWQAASGALGPTGGQALRRLRRRMDHIAAVELTLAGRVQGVATALAASSRRISAQAPAEAA